MGAGRWAARPRCPHFLGVGGVGVGTQHWPHSVRSCRLALRAVRVAGGRPLGDCTHTNRSNHTLSLIIVPMMVLSTAFSTTSVSRIT